MCRLAFQRTGGWAMKSGHAKGQKLIFVISVKGARMFSNNKEQLADWARGPPLPLTNHRSL